jgi:hypothetical protein
MRRGAGLLAALAVFLLACGYYGPPERPATPQVELEEPEGEEGEESE